MLPHFRAALERHKNELGYNQFWRYSRGRLPRIVLWLAENVDLVDALREDAIKLAAERSNNVEQRPADN